MEGKELRECIAFVLMQKGKNRFFYPCNCALNVSSAMRIRTTAEKNPSSWGLFYFFILFACLSTLLAVYMNLDKSDSATIGTT